MATPDRGADDEYEGKTLSSRRSPVRELEPCALPSDAQSTSPDSFSSGEQGLVYEEGYDVEWFVQFDVKYQCPICTMVLHDPVQTTCGHRFCNRCLKRWTREQRRPKCPVCQHAIMQSETFPDNYAKREVMSLRVRCPHYKEGCTAEMELRHQEQHAEKCPHAPVLCPLGCFVLIRRHQLEKHMTETCPHRKSRCPHCGQQFSLSDLQCHEEDCPEKLVSCSFCRKLVKKKEIEEHEQLEYSRVTVPCAYERFGCHHKFPRSEEADHLSKEVVSHLFLVSRHPSLAEPSGSGSAQDVRQAAPPTIASMTVQRTLSSYADPGFCSDYSGTSTVYSTAAKHPAAHSMERPLSDAMLPLPPVYQPFTALQPHELASGGQPPSTLGQLRAVIELQRCQLEHHERTIQQQQGQIRQLELRLREMHDTEGRVCNGRYIWRMRDYRQKRSEAVRGTAIVHHSPSFYTSLHGYKMCIRANLNGVETGKGTHLSLFIHLMQGEYDELLPWPFQGRIRLSVLDQSGSRDDIRETLEAKPGLTAFVKPTMKRNSKGFGYIEFAPLSHFDDDKYIRNDTMLVEAYVKLD